MNNNRPAQFLIPVNWRTGATSKVSDDITSFRVHDLAESGPHAVATDVIGNLPVRSVYDLVLQSTRSKELDDWGWSILGMSTEYIYIRAPDIPGSAMQRPREQHSRPLRSSRE